MKDKKTCVLLIICAVLLLGNIFQACSGCFSEDLVPDEETALRLAKVILHSYLGDMVLEYTYYIEEGRFGTTWRVARDMTHVAGLGLEIVIRKRDARVLSLRFIR